MDKLAINWQNLAQVELQLKLAFRIRPKTFGDVIFPNFSSIFSKMASTKLKIELLQPVRSTLNFGRFLPVNKIQKRRQYVISFCQPGVCQQK